MMERTFARVARGYNPWPGWGEGRLGEPSYPLAAEVGLADGVAFGEFACRAGHGDGAGF